MIHGRDLILEYNGSAIAAAKSCEVGVDTDFIEVANPTNGTWKEYVPTKQGWDASAGCLVAEMNYVDRLFDIQKAKSLLYLAFFDADLMSFYRGRAYIKSLKVTGQIGNLATMSVSFQTSGELSRAQAQALNIKSTTNTYAQSILDWTGSEVRVRKNTQSEQDAGGYVIAYEFTSTVDTRITALYQSIVVKGGVSTVGPMVSAFDTQGILSDAILVNYERKEKSAVAKALHGNLTVTMLMNYSEAILPYQFVVLKKQITQ